MYLDISHYMLTTALCNAQNTIIWNRILILVFIGPRYAWGPIYGSECLQMSDSKTLLKQVMQVMQVLQVMQGICKFCKQIMLIEHSKAMLQCKCPNARGAIFYVVLYPQGKNPPPIEV